MNTGVLSKVNGRYDKLLVALISVLLYWLIRRYCKGSKYKYIKEFLIFISIFTVWISSVNILKYPELSIYYTLRQSLIWLTFFLSVPLYYVMIKGKLINILRLINIISTFWNVIVLIQGILYASTGTIILKNYFANTNEDLAFRFGYIRIGIGSCGVFMIIYCFYKLFCEKCHYSNNKFKRIGYILELILLGFNYIMIQQSRAGIIYVLISLFLMYWVYNRGSKRWIIRGLIIVIMIYIVSYFNILDRVANSFAVSNRLNGISTKIRLQEVKYYISIFLNNIITGCLFPGGRYTYLEKGPANLYAFSDIGFIGNMAQYGIVAFLLYGVIIGRLLYILVKAKNKKFNNFEFLIGLFSYVVLSSATLIITNYGYIVLATLIVAIFEYANYCIDLRYSEDW